MLVCKTCSDCGHKCLGYNDPEKPEKPIVLGSPRNGQFQTTYAEDGDEDRSLSHSPTTSRVSLAVPVANNASKSPQPKTIKLEVPLPLTKDTLNKATREQDKLAAVASPESSAFYRCAGVCSCADRVYRPHVFELRASNPCTLFQVLWTHGHCPGVQTNGTIWMRLCQVSKMLTLIGRAGTRWEEREPVTIVR